MYRQYLHSPIIHPYPDTKAESVMTGRVLLSVLLFKAIQVDKNLLIDGDKSSQFAPVTHTK